MEEKEKKINKNENKEPKKKKRASLKSILGGDIKYDALTRSSELMERSRQSRIEEYISTKESDLQTSTNPPYLIE